MPTENEQKALTRIQVVAELMDSKFRIPGTGITFGLDPILSLIPVAGSMVSYVIAAYLVVEMVLAGASGKVAVKMILNILLDAIMGSIPFIGVIPDIFYKANIRNFKLLKEHYAEGKHRGSGVGLLLTILAVLLLIAGLVVYAVIVLIQTLFNSAEQMIVN